MDKQNALRKSSLFRGLSKRSIEGLAAICSERVFKQGELLMRQGAEGIGLFIIISGAVEVRKTKSDGSTVTVGRNGPGDAMGEFAVIDGAKRTADVVALERTVCLALTSWEFNAFMKEHPEIAVELLPAVAKRFRETQDALTARKGKE